MYKRQVLGQLISLAQQEQVDIVLIAGDVYDRSVPPAEAVALLDGVLARLVVECNIPVILIAGNHDSAERISFASRVCNARGLHLRGTLDELSPVIVEDEHGEIAFFPLPYADPIFARALPGGEHITDHQSAMSPVSYTHLDRLFHCCTKYTRSIRSSPIGGRPRLPFG